MGFRILGEQSPGTVFSIQGDVTLTITPEGTMAFVPEVGTLSDPPGYSQFIDWIDVVGKDAANQTIAQDPATNKGQQYDGAGCQRFMRLHLGEAQPYRDAEEKINIGYAVNFVDHNNGRVPGYLYYPLGLYYNIVEQGFNGSSILRSMVENNPWTYLTNDVRRNQVYSREMAYGLLTMIMYEKLVGVGNTNYTSNGRDVDQRYEFSLLCMENHLYQWRNHDFSDPLYTSRDATYMNPFMAAITCNSLQRYYDWMLETRGNGNLYWPTGNWATIPDAMNEFLTWMMDEAVVQDGTYAGDRIYQEGPGADHRLPEGGGSFMYIDSPTTGVGSPGSMAPDLNLLIAPVYGWVAHHYGNVDDHGSGTPANNGGRLYQTNRADKLFYGAAHQNLSLISPSIKENGLGMKRFNQQLVWMDAFFRYRNGL